MAGRSTQLELKYSRRGGRREGAGRKRKSDLLTHSPRPVLRPRYPVHVTMRMRRHVWNLRTRRCFTVLERAFWAGSNRFGFRIVHFSVQGNHIHLLVEANDEHSLSSGMNGLGTRVARSLNRVMKRQGRVLADRYHSRILRTPTEVRYVRNYHLTNARRHYGWRGPDPFTSIVALIAPDTYLLKRIC